MDALEISIKEFPFLSNKKGIKTLFEPKDVMFGKHKSTYNIILPHFPTVK